MKEEFQVYWTESAAKDLENIILYIAADKPEAAKIFSEKSKMQLLAYAISPCEAALCRSCKTKASCCIVNELSRPGASCTELKRIKFLSCLSSIPGKILRIFSSKRC